MSSLSERKTIQAPARTKERVESLKSVMRASTDYGVIDSLLDYYARKGNHVLLTDETRDEFRALQKRLNVRDESKLVKLLILHWDHSPSFTREIVEYYGEITY